MKRIGGRQAKPKALQNASHVKCSARYRRSAVTITLTDRRPVRVKSSLYPLIPSIRAIEVYPCYTYADLESGRL